MRIRNAFEENGHCRDLALVFSLARVRNSGALAREARSGAPWVKKCGKLPIRENLVIT